MQRIGSNSYLKIPLAEGESEDEKIAQALAQQGIKPGDPLYRPLVAFSKKISNACGLEPEICVPRDARAAAQKLVSEGRWAEAPHTLGSQPKGMTPQTFKVSARPNARAHLDELLSRIDRLSGRELSELEQAVGESVAITEVLAAARGRLSFEPKPAPPRDLVALAEIHHALDELRRGVATLEDRTFLAKQMTLGRVSKEEIDAAKHYGNRLHVEVALAFVRTGNDLLDNGQSALSVLEEAVSAGAVPKEALQRALREGEQARAAEAQAAA